MARRSFAFLAVGMVMFFFVSFASADVPHMINYQGKLTDAGGGLVNDTVQMTFSIYPDTLGSPADWSETQTQVIVENGIFNVLLGAADTIPSAVFDGNVKYLGVQVESDPEMRPLKPMVSVAYAYRAGTADGNSGDDGDWAFRITDTADTTLMTGGPWGIARYGNTLYGTNDSTHVNLGVASTTGSDGQNYKYCTVGGGYSNVASGDYATVGGGWMNAALGTYATVGGGFNNIVDSSYATVGGGWQNTARGYCGTVGGGMLNHADINFATVSGGEANNASGYLATVGGGFFNTASGYLATVGGGERDTASGENATVGGGKENTASGDRATVGGGHSNAASAYSATVPGGYADTAAGDYSLAAGNSVRISSAADYTFAFGRDFTTSTPNAVIFHNSSHEIKVGIGVTDPGNILTVQQASTTDPIADAWTVHSSRDYTKDIHELTPLEYRRALEKVLSVPVVRFRYKSADTKEKIGLIAEDAPPEIVAEGNSKAISINEYVSLLHAALKAQQEEIDALKASVHELTKERE